MKMNVKTFAIVAALAVMGGSAVFAEEVEALNVPAITNVAVDRIMVGDLAPQNEIVSILADVKVQKKNNSNIIYLKTTDGKTYVANTEGYAADAQKILEKVLAKNGKQVRVSGYANPATNVFTIIKLGTMNVSPNGADK